MIKKVHGFMNGFSPKLNVISRLDLDDIQYYYVTHPC